MKKLNILFVCDAVISQPGGAFISPLRFAELLKKRGHKVIFVAADYKNSKKIDEYKGIKVYRFRSVALPGFENLIRMAFPTVNELDEIIKREKIDLVYTVVPFPASLRAIKAARLNNLKVVSHSHAQPENILLHFPKLFQNRFFEYLVYKYLLFVYNKTDLLLCPSKFAQRKLNEHHVHVKTQVVSNGVDTSSFVWKNSTSFMKRNKLSIKDVQVLYVGRLHPEKSLDTLVKAVPFVLEKTKNVHFNIVGKGYLKEQLEKIASDLKVEEKIKFFGRVSDEDLILAYNMCDIFVLPSLAELEGMVVLEAMACGKPIVIANSKESASVDFVDGNGFLFEPKNQKDLADNLLKLIGDEKLRKKMGHESYKRSKEYDINKSVDKLEETFCRLKK